MAAPENLGKPLELGQIFPAVASQPAHQATPPLPPQHTNPSAILTVSTSPPDTPATAKSAGGWSIAAKPKLDSLPTTQVTGTRTPPEQAAHTTTTAQQVAYNSNVFPQVGKAQAGGAFQQTTNLPPGAASKQSAHTPLEQHNNAAPNQAGAASATKPAQTESGKPTNKSETTERARPPGVSSTAEARYKAPSLVTDVVKRNRILPQGKLEVDPHLRKVIADLEGCAKKLSDLAVPNDKKLDDRWDRIQSGRAISGPQGLGLAEKRTDYLLDVSTDQFVYSDNFIEAGPAKYLNASPMEFNGVTYIAAQGVETHNLQTFVDGLVKTKTKTIVTLGNPETAKFRTAANTIKLGVNSEIRKDSYIPDSEGIKYWDLHPKKLITKDIEGKAKVEIMKEQETKTLPDGRTISVDEKEEMESDGPEKLIRRVLVIKDKEGKVEAKITHFEYVNWPDMGVPQSKVLFNKLQDGLDNQLKLESGPVLVHCRAGVGRTGTFIAAHSINYEIKEKIKQGAKPSDIKVNIEGRINDMRMYRKGMVQTKEQLGMVYQSVVRTVKNLKKPK